MKCLHNYARIILFPLLLFIAACGPDNPIGPDDPDDPGSTFSVSTNPLEFDAKAGTKDFTVLYNGEWEISEISEHWCSAERHGDIVVVDVTENLARESRYCLIGLRHDIMLTYVTVVQAGRETDPGRPEVPEGGYTLNDRTVIAEEDVNALLDGGYDNGQWEKGFYLKKPVPEGKLPTEGENWVFNTPTETFPDGCLAFIQEVKDMGDRYEIRYSDAGLTSCFRDLNLPEQDMDIASYVARIEDGNGRPLSFSRTKAASKSEPFELKIHPGALSAGGLEIEPTISLSTVLKTRADIEDYKVYSLDFVIDTDCTIEMDYNVSAGVDVDFYLPVLKVYMAAIPVGPLLITPFLEVNLEVGSCIQGSINAKYEYSRHIRASAHYDDMNSWSADITSAEPDGKGWKPSRLGPKLECSTSYGVGIAPTFGLYGDVISAGIGVSAGMTHKVEAGIRWNDPYNYNWIANLQESEYSTSFNLGMHLSASGLGFPISFSLPDVEFPLTSCKMLPSISSVAQECRGADLDVMVWMKNKHLYSNLPMRVRMTQTVGSKEVTAEFTDASRLLETLNEGDESVCLETRVRLEEGAEYSGCIEMDFGEGIGWMALPDGSFRTICLSSSNDAAIRGILADIYACRSGDWNGCNWSDNQVPLSQLANVRYENENFRITIPEEWKLSSKLKVADHTGGVDDFNTWTLWANGSSNRSFTTVEVNDKCCKEFYVGENVENYSMHSQKLSKFDIPENVKSIDMGGTSFTDINIALDIYKNLRSVILDGCTKLGKLSLNGSTPAAAMPTLSILDCSALKTIYLGHAIIEDGPINGTDWPESLERITMENSQITATSLNIPVQELFLYSCTCDALSVSGCTGMKELYMSLDSAGSISVSQCPSLQTLRVGWNMSSLAVTDCPNLTSLTARETQMSSFSASSLPSLTDLDLYNNKNLTGVMLPIFDEVRNKPGSTLSYDQRYWYYSDGTYRDEGYGYYYSDEPDRGYHLK